MDDEILDFFYRYRVAACYVVAMSAAFPLFLAMTTKYLSIDAHIDFATAARRVAKRNRYNIVFYLSFVASVVTAIFGTRFLLTGEKAHLLYRDLQGTLVVSILMSLWLAYGHSVDTADLREIRKRRWAGDLLAGSDSSGRLTPAQWLVAIVWGIFNILVLARLA